jgi:hypothetical protein
LGTLLSRPRRPDQADAQGSNDGSDHQTTRHEHSHEWPTRDLSCRRGNWRSVRTDHGQLGGLSLSETLPDYGCRNGQRVAAPRHRLDDLLLDIAERAPDVTDAARDRVVCHHEPRPDGGDQLVLGHDVARVAHQEGERIEGQRSQFDVGARAP